VHHNTQCLTLKLNLKKIKVGGGAFLQAPPKTNSETTGKL